MNNKLIDQLISYARANNSLNLVINEDNCSLLKKNQARGKISLNKKQQGDLIDTFNLLSKSIKDDLFTNKKIKIKHRGKVYNCHLSMLASNKQNRVVMNLEESHLDIKRINSLGFSSSALKEVKNLLNTKSGLILIAGNSQSGKTTSYYSLLNHLNKTNKSFYSLEKYPVCSLPYITTLEINEKLNLVDYLNKLRKIDADVVGIDHLESQEEVKAAISQANNGHLIIATIESENAITALKSLINTGLPLEEIAKSLRLIIAQKMLKKTCPHCLQTKNIDKNYLDLVKKTTKNPKLIKRAYFSPGCNRCNFSGQSSNFPVFEMLKINKDKKIDQNYRPFIYDTLEKANHGLFSPEEILKSFK